VVKKVDHVVTLPDGRTRRIRAPENADPSSIFDFALQSSIEEDERRAARPGFWESIGRGGAMYGDLPKTGALLTAQTPEEELAAEQAFLEGDDRPRFELDETTGAFKRGDYGRGLVDLWGLAKQTTGESIGMMSPAIVGSLAAPFTYGTSAVAGWTALGGLYLTQNLERQAQVRQAARERNEPEPDWDYKAAAAAAGGQAALDRVLLGVSKILPIGKKTGEEAFKEAAKLSEEGFLRSAGVGTARTAAVESPVEVGQQALERWQAGLALGGDDAREEYIEAGILGLLPSPAFGTVGRRMEVGRARRVTRAQEELEAQRAAAEAQRTAALTAGREAEIAATGGQMPLPGFERVQTDTGLPTYPTAQTIAADRDISPEGRRRAVITARAEELIAQGIPPNAAYSQAVNETPDFGLRAEAFEPSAAQMELDLRMPPPARSMMEESQQPPLPYTPTWFPNITSPAARVEALDAELAKIPSDPQYAGLSNKDKKDIRTSLREELKVERERLKGEKAAQRAYQREMMATEEPAVDMFGEMPGEPTLDVVDDRLNYYERRLKALAEKPASQLTEPERSEVVFLQQDAERLLNLRDQMVGQEPEAAPDTFMQPEAEVEAEVEVEAQITEEPADDAEPIADEDAAEEGQAETPDAAVDEVVLEEDPQETKEE